MYTAVASYHQGNTYRRSRSRKVQRSFQFHKFVMFIVFTLLIAFLCGITFGSMFASAQTTEEKAQDTFKYYKTITVESGDSLWEIASENISDEYDSMDDYIAEVCSINGLDSTQIHAGRSLTVPYYSAEFK